MNLRLARDRYKQFYKSRTQEFIRGRGTVAEVMDEVCMGCTHCFDNCAFEAIDMADRRFVLPEHTYTSRKAVIVYDNCVGCEKCAIVCPVDAITMIPKHGFEIREGKMVQVTPPVPPKPAAPKITPASPRATEASSPQEAPEPTAPDAKKAPESSKASDAQAEAGAGSEASEASGPAEET